MHAVAQKRVSLDEEELRQSFPHWKGWLGVRLKNKEGGGGSHMHWGGNLFFLSMRKDRKCKVTAKASFSALEDAVAAGENSDH